MAKTVQHEGCRIKRIQGCLNLGRANIRLDNARNELKQIQKEIPPLERQFTDYGHFLPDTVRRIRALYKRECELEEEIRLLKPPSQWEFIEYVSEEKINVLNEVIGC